MALRWKPPEADIDPESPRAWGTCDRCGRIYNLHKLQWQYNYNGSTVPQNTRFLVCERCNDPLNPQDLPFILPPDPLPVYNARPEPYAVDETSWLATQDANQIATQADVPIITNIENPASDANTAALVAELSYPGGTIATAMYLDLFNGNPLQGGASVLASITGSSTRTDISSQLSLTGANIAVNPNFITVTSASLAVSTVNYIGFYSASISGALLTSGPVAVTGYVGSVGKNTVVQFNPLNLRISLS